MRILLVSLLLVATAFGGEINQERLWTGRNGKSFRGIFVKLIDDDRRVQIASSSGQIFTIDLENLSIPDRQLILDTKAPEPAAEADKDDPEADVEPGFKKPPVMPRNTIMPTTPEAVGSRKSDELLDPMWQFVGWWDTERVLPIPRDGDFDDRLEWAHERLARYCKIRTGGSVLDVEALREGLEKYFEEHLKDHAVITVREDTDFSPTALGRYATGINAVILRITMTYANGRDFRTCAGLESIDDQGNAVLHMWGQRKNAKLELEKRRPPEHNSRSLSSAKSSYRITLADRDDLPDFVTDNQATFFVDPEKYDTVVIAKPYLFAKEGVPRPIPLKDPLFTPADGNPTKLQPSNGAGRIALPIDFRSDFAKSSIWDFNDGSTFDGKLGFDKEQAPILRDNSGKSRKLEVADLTPEAQAAYYFTQGCSGTAADPARLELRYHLDTQHGKDYDFTISAEGSLGRIDFPATSSTLIFDLKDQAYVATRASRRYHGRWESKGLVPHQRFAGTSEKEKHQNFGDTIQTARMSPDSSFPARFATFPFASKSFANPRVDFTLMKQPTAMVALYQLLCSSSPASRDPQNPKDPTRQLIIVFTQPTEVSNHSGLREIAPRFVDHYMLPLHLAWTNARNNSWVREEDRHKASGQFSLTLTSAKVPEAFPNDHFRIPEEARKAEIGTCIQSGK